MDRIHTPRKGLGWLVAAGFVLCALWADCSESVRDRLLDVARSQLYVRESGNNDGKEVRKYLRSTGLGPGYPWCAAFVNWCHEEVNLPSPGSARVTDWFKGNLVKDWRKPDFEVERGSVLGLYYEHLKRLGHIAIVEDSDKNNFYVIHGNTNGAGSREGDGVYRGIWPKKMVSAVADYCLTINEFEERYYGTGK